MRVQTQQDAPNSIWRQDVQTTLRLSYVLDYAGTYNEPTENVGPYAYTPGETLRLQLMCTGSLPHFYKQMDDGVGERAYEMADIWHDNTKPFCPED